mmetsp:Transcript_3676/g.12892  ORF Transcript_3676/g.12892 Transcript_3676/m.12892 type:complete len:682 (+) Transcript_3676:1816-3861(+)
MPAFLAFASSPPGPCTTSARGSWTGSRACDVASLCCLYVSLLKRKTVCIIVVLVSSPSLSLCSSRRRPVLGLQQLVDSPHGLRLPALREPGLCAGPAVKVDVDPVRALVGELLQEERRGDRAPPRRRPDVVHVCHLAVQHLGVGLPQRQPPHGVVVLQARGVHLLRELVIVSEDAGEVPPKRHAVRSRQRRHVQQEVGLLGLGGEREAVRQNQPALGVRVPDLHGLPAPAVDDITGPKRVSGHAVLHAGKKDTKFHVELGAHHHGGQAEHARRASHVLLHGEHAAGRLDVQASRVEADALAHDGDEGRVRPLAGAPDHVHNERVPPRGRRPPHRVDQREAPLQLRPLDDLHVRAVGLAQPLGGAGQVRRTQVAARRVDQVAPQEHRVDDELALAPPGFVVHAELRDLLLVRRGAGISGTGLVLGRRGGLITLEGVRTEAPADAGLLVGGVDARPGAGLDAVGRDGELLRQGPEREGVGARPGAEEPARETRARGVWDGEDLSLLARESGALGELWQGRVVRKSLLELGVQRELGDGPDGHHTVLGVLLRGREGGGRGGGEAGGGGVGGGGGKRQEGGRGRPRAAPSRTRQQTGTRERWRRRRCGRGPGREGGRLAGARGTRGGGQNERAESRKDHPVPGGRRHGGPPAAGALHRRDRSHPLLHRSLALPLPVFSLPLSLCF